jgi:hypothetical integral membrane protein (TIGR02206 family)
VKAAPRAAVTAGIVIILGTQLAFAIVLCTPRGIRIRSPEGAVPLGRSFVVAGDAWAPKAALGAPGGIRSIKVEAVAVDMPGTPSVVVEAVRDVVRYQKRVLFPLSSWSASVQLPSDGTWNLRAVAEATDGGRITTTERSLLIEPDAPVREFRSWTPAHLIPLACIAVGSVALALFARRGRKSSPDGIGGGIGATPRFTLVASVCVAVMWANELAYQLYWFLVGGWSVPSALMLQMCGLSILCLPVMMFAATQRVRQAMFDVLYFWAIGGAIQALIAPDIGPNGFPAFKYFAFFVSHGLIIACAVLMAIAGGVRITGRSFLRALVATNLLLIPIYGIDQALALIPPYDPGNYFVLGYPPPTGSIVDLFSEWFGPAPRYFIGLELMGLVVFLVLYLPWPIARALSRRAARA